MKFYADLHIHSRFSRATSKDLNLEQLAFWAQIKGLTVVSTGDCIHPGWLGELKKKLVPAEPGLFRLKPEFMKEAVLSLPPACQGEVRFILTTEISNIYKRDGKVRKVHNVVFVPSFEAANKIQARLDKIGNIRSDGRPILGLDSQELLKIVLDSDPLSFLVPAHIWTPWFSMLGSKSGFDSVEDCFGDLTKEVFAVETGLSSDPAMNWRLSQLDNLVLISNSDAHSAQKLGRECNLFDTELSYQAIYRALKDPEDRGFLGTVEFYPEEGKYHYDGHRNCGVRLHPRETIKNKGVCPQCGKPVTIGVMARVEALADHSEGRKSPRWRPFYSLVPLQEIIAEARGVGPNSQNVLRMFMDLVRKTGNEMRILRELPVREIEAFAGDLIAEGIRRVRDGQVEIAAGYDGEYGTIKLFSQQERQGLKDQMRLF